MISLVGHLLCTNPLAEKVNYSKDVYQLRVHSSLTVLMAPTATGRDVILRHSFQIVKFGQISLDSQDLILVFDSFIFILCLSLLQAFNY